MDSEGKADQPKATVKEAGSLGGKARAEILSPEQRSEIAKKAAEERWLADLPRSTHAGVLKLGGTSEIQCAVLEDCRRVLTQETVLVALGRSARPKAGTGISGKDGQLDKLPPFLAARNLNPFIDEELRNSTTPIVFRNQQGKKSYGYLATVLPAVCKVYLDADRAGAICKSLIQSQEPQLLQVTRKTSLSLHPKSVKMRSICISKKKRLSAGGLLSPGLLAGLMAVWTRICVSSLGKNTLTR